MSEQPQPGTPPATEEQRRAATREREAQGASTSGEVRLDPRARVLVVEDEHELRELIATWLETRNYQVVQAADGREFLEWLRASPKHRDRHVIVASGYLDDEHPVDVDRAFAKPFRPDLLERELARLASGV